MKAKYTALILIVVVFTILGGVMLGRHGQRFSFRPTSYQSSWYTCEICGSTRSLDRKYFLGYFPEAPKVQVLYQSPGFSSCGHNWEPGISRTPPDPVPDGIVVLVRKSGKYGAFVLRNQTGDPEGAEYDWWYQSDGSGSFDSNSVGVSSGKGTTPKIRFGAFDISWSGNSEGSGWLYYEHKAGDLVAPDDLYFCITKLGSVDGINATDPKWVYKATPID